MTNQTNPQATEIKTSKLLGQVNQLVREIENYSRLGRTENAEMSRKSLRDLAGYRTPSGTWRIHCVTVEQQAELSL
jgi:hypothetical protein